MHCDLSMWILVHVTVTPTPFKSSCTHQKIPHLETNTPPKHTFLLLCVCEHSSLWSLREAEKGFSSSTFAEFSPHQDIIHLIHKFRSIQPWGSYHSKSHVHLSTGGGTGQHSVEAESCSRNFTGLSLVVSHDVPGSVYIYGCVHWHTRLAVENGVEVIA